MSRDMFLTTLSLSPCFLITSHSCLFKPPLPRLKDLDVQIPFYGCSGVQIYLGLGLVLGLGLNLRFRLDPG